MRNCFVGNPSFTKGVTVFHEKIFAKWFCENLNQTKSGRKEFTYTVEICLRLIKPDWVTVLYLHNFNYTFCYLHCFCLLTSFRTIFFGLFRNRSVCFGCFDMDSKHRNEPKQTEKIIDWFRETNRKSTETDRVSVSFGSNRNFFFICFEDTLVWGITVRRKNPSWA
jgi:hypothetical protein